MSKCSICPYHYFDCEENHGSCGLDESLELPVPLWNENKNRCRIPLFVLKIMHKRDMKAEAKYWGDLSEETICKNQGWVENEQFREEYLGQFIDDNNPEGRKTINNWRNVDKE